MLSKKDGNRNTRPIQENEIACHSDYLRGSHESLSPEDFSQLISFFSRDHVVEMNQFWSPGGSAKYYPNRVIGINGFIGGFKENDDGSIACMLQAPGGYFEQLDLVGQWRLFRGLKHRFQLQISRMDLAIDDPTYSVIPVDDMWDAANNGNNFYFRKIGMAASGQCGKDMKVTRYFGSRESGAYTRIYDHDGECLRHETEFKRNKAQLVFNVIADLEREDFLYEDNGVMRYRDSDGTFVESFDDIIARRMGGLVVGAIDFRTRDAYKDSSRVSARDSDRLGFYQEYIDKVGAVVCRVKPSRPVRTLHKTYEWLKRQCAPTLAMFAEGLGRHQFNLLMREIVSEAELRMDNLKNLWVKEIRRKPTCFR